MDAHYTPASVAEKLVAAADDLRPIVVADLCAGHGDLLVHAERRWPQVRCVGVDVDRLSVQHLRRTQPHWHVGVCDLRSARSRGQSSVLKRFHKRVSLLLLNPPFSCRGNSRLRSETPNGPIYSGTAMSFLITSLAYLHRHGSAVAVLPLGTLYNQKDRGAWEYLRGSYSIEIITVASPGVFPRSSAKIVLVRLSPQDCGVVVHDASDSGVVRCARARVRITRGCQPIYRTGVTSTGPVLVHSTDLRSSRVYMDGRRGVSEARRLSGPSVLVPRVGQITKDKIALLHTLDTPIVLSDCVIGISTRTLDEARKVQKLLIENFLFLKAQYVGTGAPFVTLQRLRVVLNQLGIACDDEN